MHRYIEVDEYLTEVFLNVLEKVFPRYQTLKFKLIFDLKKRISQGKLTLASIELASPKIKFFSKDNIATEGYDYIIIIDKKAWEFSSEFNKLRILRHELRHVFIDEKGTPKLIGHEIEDFYSEIELNKDDPEWRRIVTTLIIDAYKQERDMAKEKAKEN